MDYDAIVVGTGFGGVVAATKLAERNKRVLMLERGLWWYSPERPLPPYLQANGGSALEQPVQYWPRPNHTEGLASLLATVQTSSPTVEKVRQRMARYYRDSHGGLAPQPLYRYTMFPDVHVVTASGVGGGSLVYANVAMEPYYDEATRSYPVMDSWSVQLDRTDYEHARAWIEQYRGKLRKIVTRLTPAQGLDVTDLPDDKRSLYLGKSRALRDAASNLADEWKQRMLKGWEPLDLSVTESDGANDGCCERQGRCFLGCLSGARHTLNKALIQWLLAPPPGGPRRDVTLRSLSAVDHVRSHPAGGYEVRYADLRDDSHHAVTAPVVILAAGTLGSTELLLRSQAKGTLVTSDALGSRFSTNGDFTGFAVLPRVRPVVADPPPPLDYPVVPTRGPTNTAHVMFGDGGLHVTVTDGGIPPMFASVVRAGLHVMEDLAQRGRYKKELRDCWIHGRLPDLWQFLPHPGDPSGWQTEDEQVANVFWFNCMGTDGANGRFSLSSSGDLTLSYEGGKLADHPVFTAIDGVMRALTRAMGGEFVPNPLWEGLADRKLVSIFPLGGCPMGHAATDAVVDPWGRVFSARSGSSSVHQGLYVMDGSVIPGPLAAQPSLSVIALALRMAASVP